MTPREMKHELVALREGLKGVAERLGELYKEVEWEEKKPGEVVCVRCKRVAENEEAFPEEFQRRRELRVGKEKVHLTPVQTVILEMLLAGKGKIVSWDRLLFNIYESEMSRPWLRDKETEYQRSALQVTIVKLRKKLKGLPVSVDTVWGVGLVLVVEEGVEVRLR